MTTQTQTEARSIVIDGVRITRHQAREAIYYDAEYDFHLRSDIVTYIAGRLVRAQYGRTTEAMNREAGYNVNGYGETTALCYQTTALRPDPRGGAWILGEIHWTLSTDELAVIADWLRD